MSCSSPTLLSEPPVLERSAWCRPVVVETFAAWDPREEESLTWVLEEQRDPMTVAWVVVGSSSAVDFVAAESFHRRNYRWQWSSVEGHRKRDHYCHHRWSGKGSPQTRQL
mmetsp:Transcript_58441/g.169544  ORF Transcript_58441/g.169544 Transcript_58441/m.169544 type:complete len:110 (+) Transcript_58441:183-512(+)